MAGRISHAINIRIRQFNDEEEDARKGEEETTFEEEHGRDTEDQHAQPQAVQLPEAHQSRTAESSGQRLIKSNLVPRPCYSQRFYIIA